MEPVTTTAIASFLIYLAKVGVEKAVETISENSTNGATKWLKSLFYKDDKPKRVLENLKEEPNNEEFQKNAISVLENSLEDNSNYSNYLKELVENNKNKVEQTLNGIVITGTVSTTGGNSPIIISNKK